MIESADKGEIEIQPSGPDKIPVISDELDIITNSPNNDDATGSIVPRMFNQLNIIMIDISETMLEHRENQLAPFDSIYYALSDYLENLFSFRHKKCFSLAVLTFAKDSLLVMEVTNLEQKQGNIALNFLPHSAEEIALKNPDQIKESNLIPALKIASELAVKFHENPPDSGLPNYVSLNVNLLCDLLNFDILYS